MQSVECKILVVDDDMEQRQLLRLYFSFNLPAVVVLEAASVEEALLTIEREKTIQCVISDYDMPRKTGGDLLLELKRREIKTPMILCTSRALEQCGEFTNEEYAAFIQKPLVKATFENLLRQVKPILRISEEIEARRAFHPVSLALLLKLAIVPCDCFLKISDAKFLKISNAGDPLLQVDVDRYQAKAVFDFYVAETSCEVLLTAILASLPDQSLIVTEGLDHLNPGGGEIERQAQESLSNLVRVTQQLQRGGVAFSEVFQVSIQTEAAVRSLWSEGGVTPALEASMKIMVRLAVAVLEQVPEFSQHLSYMRVHPESYLSSHSVLLAYVSCWVASRVGWVSDFTRYKLILASLAHDLPLKDDRLARIQDETEVMMATGELSADEIDTYMGHPRAAADILRRFVDIPGGVDTIVFQHHELPDGSGFPNRLSAEDMHPLACVFVVAHDLVMGALARGTGIDVDGFLKSKSSRYQKGFFEKIIGAGLSAP